MLPLLAAVCGDLNAKIFVPLLLLCPESVALHNRDDQIGEAIAIFTCLLFDFVDRLPVP